MVIIINQILLIVANYLLERNDNQPTQTFTNNIKWILMFADDITILITRLLLADTACNTCVVLTVVLTGHLVFCLIERMAVISCIELCDVGLLNYQLLTINYFTLADL